MGGDVPSFISDFISDLTLLRTIWLSSILLGGLSSAVMVLLVVFRLRQNKQDEKKEVQLKKMRRRVLEFLDSGSDLITLQENFKGEDLGLVREVVMGLLGSVKGETRDLLIALLWGVGVRDQAVDHLKAGGPIEKLNAIEVLGLFSDADAIKSLRAALDDEEPNVRLMSANALAENDPELRVSELVDKLDIGGSVRSRMLREIFLQVGRRHVRDLIDLLEGVKIEDISVLVLYAVGRIQDYSVVPAVIRQMISDSVNVRAEALRALTSIGHPSCMPAVLEALHDPAWPVRAQAAVCAGKIGFTNATELLSELLDDSEWWVRFRAAEALSKLGSDGISALETISRGEGRAAQMAELVLSEKEVA